MLHAVPLPQSRVQVGLHQAASVGQLNKGDSHHDACLDGWHPCCWNLQRLLKQWVYLHKNIGTGQPGPGDALIE